MKDYYQSDEPIMFVGRNVDLTANAMNRAVVANQQKKTGKNGLALNSGQNDDVPCLLC